MTSFTPVLRRLALPLYLPTLAQGAGFTALAPVLPLLALDLGFSVPASAALGLITGVLGVVGPMPAGRLIAALGERPTMLATGVAMVLVFLTGWWVSNDGITGTPTTTHRLGLLGVIVGLGLGQQVWGIARQAYVGNSIDPSLRARAMSTFGGMMRIGQVIGPVLGAAAVARWGTPAVFILTAAMMALATVLVAVFLVPLSGEGIQTPQSASSAPVTAPGPLWRDPIWRRMLTVALGTAPLQMARISRPVVLPLVGAHLGLDAATISLVFAIGAVIEIAMFVPAGTLMDRYGRTMVLVPCLLVLGVSYVGLAIAATTIGPRWPLATLAAAAVMMALGNGFGAGIVMTLGLDLTPEHGRAVHLGRWMALTGVGPLLGPALVSAVSVVAPVAMAGGLLGALCVAGGLWTLRVLPALTPNPPAGPFHRAGSTATP